MEKTTTIQPVAVDLYTRCGIEYNRWMSEDTDEFFDHAVGTMNLEKVNALVEHMDGKKTNEANMKKLAPFFLHEHTELQKVIQEAEAAKEALEAAFVHKYTYCFYEDGQYDHGYLYDLAVKRTGEHEDEEKFKLKYGISSAASAASEEATMRD